MGVMLSLLIGFAGVVEALACYRTIACGLLPPEKANFDNLKKTYDSMIAASLSRTSSRSDNWKVGVQGYLDIKGGGKDGPIQASIKYLGEEDDTTHLLFSKKISSFGQESTDYESENHTINRSQITTQMPQGQSVYLEHHKSSPVEIEESNFWGGEDEEKPKEKVTWHYRPLTPTNESSLPEIHFDSYDKPDMEDGSLSYSEDYLR